MSTTIVFSSEKGGVGKTTSAVNLSASLVSANFRVLVVDMDPQSSVRFSSGVSKESPLGTYQLLTDPQTPLENLIQITPGLGLDYIFANFKDWSQENDTLWHIQPDTLKNRLNLASNYDFIILDAPASLNMLTLNAITAANIVILPLQCESLAMHSLKRYLQGFHYLQQKHNPSIRIAGILLTMFDKNLAIHRRLCQQIYRTLGDSVLKTIIPRSRELVEASALGQSVLTYNAHSIAATSYLHLSKEILQNFYYPHSATRSYANPT